MTPSWRLQYSRRACTFCYGVALFHIENLVPVCDECSKLRTPFVGVATENIYSDVVYHGRNYSDDPVGDLSR
jgi:hypothetical protein